MIESPCTINRSWSVAACTSIFLINSPGYVILKKMISEKLVGWSKDKNQNQKGVKLIVTNEFMDTANWLWVP